MIETEGPAGSVTPNLAITRVAGVGVVYGDPARTARPARDFGELLGPAIVARVVGALGLSPTPFEPGCEAPSSLAVGLDLYLVPEGAVVWGAGVDGRALAETRCMSQVLDVRSVRGPWTRRLLAEQGYVVPPVYGDPTSLVGYVMPELERLASSPQRDVLFVPNAHELSTLGRGARELGIPVLDPSEHLEHVLMQIASSGFVIGSSLHAVMVADALGIPARLVRAETEHPFKYRDYLMGTGRPFALVARTVEDALELGGHASAEIDVDAMISAFPRDLWEERGTRKAARATLSAHRERIEAASWDSALEEPASVALGRDSIPYQVALSSLLANAEGPTLADEARRLIDQRKWCFSELDPDDLPDALVGLDLALQSGDVEGVLRAVARARVGVRAIAYSALDRPSGTVLSLIVTPPSSREQITEIRIVHDGSCEVVTLPSSIIPDRVPTLDLDVVVPSNWHVKHETHLTIQIVYALRPSVVVDVEWSSSMPTIDPLRSAPVAPSGFEVRRDAELEC